MHGWTRPVPRLVTQVGTGLDLLASSERCLRDRGARQIRCLIDFASTTYRYTVIDVPRSDNAVLDALDRANTIVIIANQELATVRSAGRMAAAFGSGMARIACPWSSRAMTSARRSGSRTSSGSSAAPVAHILPNNYAVTVASLNKGRPLVMDNHTKLAGAFSSLAHSLAKLTPTKPAKEKSGGLFSRLSGRR